MGVHGESASLALALVAWPLTSHSFAGLWQLLQPVARPIALETMGNKRLAIDSSIWVR